MRPKEKQIETQERGSFMILLLIFLLIMIDIGLRISIVGIDLAFFVGGRVDAIRRGTETAVYYTAKRGKKAPVKAAMRSARFVSRSVDKVARVGLGAAKTIGKLAVKSGIKIVQKCISLLWKLLLIVESVILILDIIVFLVVVVISYYALQMGMA